MEFDVEMGTMSALSIVCLEYTDFSTKTTVYNAHKTTDQTISIDFTSHASQHTNIRFYVARIDATGASKYFFLDNVQITDLTETNEGGQLGIPITAAAYPDVIQSGDYSPFGGAVGSEDVCFGHDGYYGVSLLVPRAGEG